MENFEPPAAILVGTQLKDCAIGARSQVAVSLSNSIQIARSIRDQRGQDWQASVSASESVEYGLGPSSGAVGRKLENRPVVAGSSLGSRPVKISLAIEKQSRFGIQTVIGPALEAVKQILLPGTVFRR